MMIDPAVCLDEPYDPLLVELIQLVYARPGREGDPSIHPGVRGEDHLGVVAEDEGTKLCHEVGALPGAVVLDEDSAPLEVVDLELVRNRLGVDAPRAMTGICGPEVGGTEL